MEDLSFFHRTGSFGVPLKKVQIYLGSDPGEFFIGFSCFFQCFPTFFQLFSWLFMFFHVFHGFSMVVHSCSWLFIVVHCFFTVLGQGVFGMDSEWMGWWDQTTQ